jgi:hypothetical protein
VLLITAASFTAACSPADSSTQSPSASCRRLSDALAVLKAPDTKASLGDVATFTDRVSRRLEEASASLRGRVSWNAAADRLSEAVDYLDDATAAARRGDRDLLTDRILHVNDRLAKADVAVSALGVDTCKVGSLLQVWATTTTTEPPEVTLSPDTVPLDTSPSTSAVSTVPVADQREESLAGRLGVSRDFQFSDISSSLTRTWIDTFDSTAIGRRTAGSYGGVEVTDSTGNVFARILTFRADAPTDSRIFEQLRVIVASKQQQPAIIGGLTGVEYLDPTNGYFFLATTPAAAPTLVVLAVSTNDAGLRAAVTAFSGVI